MIESPTTEAPMSGAMRDLHDYGERADECVRRHPASAVLFALGAGLVLGLIVRGLRPEPTPRHRLMRLVDDLESRLHDLIEPAVGKASTLAHDGASALQHGEARVGRLVRDAGKRVRKLFH